MDNIYYGTCPKEFQYISHHGVKGMHWGVRRYQRKDGTLTSAGKKHYVKKVVNKVQTFEKEHPKAVKAIEIGATIGASVLGAYVGSIYGSFAAAGTTALSRTAITAASITVGDSVKKSSGKMITMHVNGNTYKIKRL